MIEFEQPRRSSAANPYQWPDRTLVISPAIIDLTFNGLDPYRTRQVEACCFWYGRAVLETVDQVCAVVIPRQINRRYNFEVPSSSILAMATATRPRNWKNLAQLHTHPDSEVEHSGYDDLLVNSRRALSIVLPNYGVRGGQWSADIGVHEFQNDYWHLLTTVHASKRIRIEASIEGEMIDLR
jgi:hypothetical protein